MLLPDFFDVIIPFIGEVGLIREDIAGFGGGQGFDLAEVFSDGPDAGSHRFVGLPEDGNDKGIYSRLKQKGPIESDFNSVL